MHTGRRALTLVVTLAVAGGFWLTPLGARVGLPVGPLPALASSDSCGYPSGTGLGQTAFNESTVTRWAQVNGQGTSATISVFANDEKSLLLGVNGATAWAKVGTNAFGYASPANLGNPAATDTSQRPSFPALFISDVTGTGATAGTPEPGDWQMGGQVENLNGSNQPYADAVFGTWATAAETINHYSGASTKSGSAIITISGVPTSAVNAAIGDSNLAIPQGATVKSVSSTSITISTNATATTSNDSLTTISGYTPTVPSTSNNWTLGPGSDTPTVGFSALGTNEGYGTEVRWNVSSLHDFNTTTHQYEPLTPGHTYKVQIMTHDGDQNKSGGDAGEYCTLLTIPGAPTITTQPNSSTGPGVTGGFGVNVPLGASVNDTANFSGTQGAVTGTATFKIYQYPAGTTTFCSNGSPTGTNVTPGAWTPVAISSGQATSPSFTTDASTNYVYMWQTTYTPSSGAPYIAATETCGVETVTTVAARIALTPHTATNIVGNPHTLTATLQSSTDGTHWTSGLVAAGQTISFSFVNAGNAYFGTTAPGTSTASCSADALSGACTATINDATAESVTVHAAATNVQFSGVTGTFASLATVAGGSDSTGDALKTYVQPTTRPHVLVQDQLLGLPSNTVITSLTYSYYNNAGCSSTGTGNTVTTNTVSGATVDANGAATMDPTGFSAPANSTVYIQATLTGTINGEAQSFTSACGLETVASADNTP